MNFLFFFIVLLFLFLVWNIVQREWFHTYQDPVLKDLVESVKHLHPKFEKIRFFEANKSYTINKKYVYLCLRDENGKYYNRNMLVYVLLHELAHTLNKESGHTKKFAKIFNNLLIQAAKEGIYNPSIPPVEQYCGHH